MTGVLHEEQYTFFIISRSVRLIIRNVSDKTSERIKTNLMFYNFCFEFREIMGKIWKSRTRHRWQYGACALHAGYLRVQTNTSEYVTLITFPPKQRLHERASLLRDAYIACLVDCWLQMYVRIKISYIEQQWDSGMCAVNLRVCVH
jgi:hypothetical protein